MKITYLIVPGETPFSGDPNPAIARVYVKRHPDHLAHGLRDYRGYPEQWKEAGHINSKGELVCLEAPKHVWEDLKSQEPLMASTSYTYDEPL